MSPREITARRRVGNEMQLLSESATVATYRLQNPTHRITVMAVKDICDVQYMVRRGGPDEQSFASARLLIQFLHAELERSYGGFVKATKEEADGWILDDRSLPF